MEATDDPEAAQFRDDERVPKWGGAFAELARWSRPREGGFAYLAFKRDVNLGEHLAGRPFRDRHSRARDAISRNQQRPARCTNLRDKGVDPRNASNGGSNVGIAVLDCISGDRQVVDHVARDLLRELCADCCRHIDRVRHANGRQRYHRDGWSSGWRRSRAVVRAACRRGSSRRRRSGVRCTYGGTRANNDRRVHGRGKDHDRAESNASPEVRASRCRRGLSRNLGEPEPGREARRFRA